MLRLLPSLRLRSRARRLARKATRKLVALTTPPPHPTGFYLEGLARTAPPLRPSSKPPTPRRLGTQALREGRFLHPVFTTHVAHRPPDPDVVFASVCNDKYCPGLEALILSLLRQYPDLTNRYVVYHDGHLSPFNQRRLRSLYPHFEFVQENPQKYAVKLGTQDNHVRVGLLGYLSLEALTITDASYVVILDSDLLVLGDISPLWSGDTIKAAPDVGVWPFAIISSVTGKPVLNSGVLSFPGSRLGPNTLRRRDEVLARLEQHQDPDLARFADQRFWNVFLAEEPNLELLPLNFNCVKDLATEHFPAEIGNVSVLHFTGPKPWYGFLNADLLREQDRARYRRGSEKHRAAFALWEDLHTRELAKVRLRQFRKDCAATLSELRDRLGARPAVMIGNGPSIQRTNLDLFDGFEKFTFNWFVNHDDWDRVKPDHLVVASHMLFGGWHTPEPKLPPEYLQALTRHRHRPRLWFSYYFKDYVESLDELRGFEIGYFFFEKPFKRRIAKTGQVELDLENPLVDANTGVITAGIPIAVHMGARKIVLVGCDSNYDSTRGSYFYSAARHASPTTEASSLLKTWQKGGEGAYGYTVVLRALEARGIGLWDATLDGSLDVLPKLSLDSVRELLGS